MRPLARNHPSEHAEISTRAPGAAPGLDAAASPLSVESWPAGVVRFDGETLTIGAGELRLIALRSLESLEIRPKGGRLQLRLAYRAGLDHVRTAVWIDPAHELALRQLVETVLSARSTQSPEIA